MTMPSTLYHYCSTFTFQKIVEEKSIRLSSLSLSNDSMEGKLVGHAIERLAARYLTPKETLDHLLNMLSDLESGSYGFGFCLSEAEDLLSQWRGYADNGTGVSIGFSVDYLRKLADRNRNSAVVTETNSPVKFNLERAEYDPARQELLVLPIYEEILKYINSGAFRPHLNIALMATHGLVALEHEEQRRSAFLNLQSVMFKDLLSKLYVLKSKAFEEEREWRLLSQYDKGDLIDHRYRPTFNSLIAYRTLSLENFNEAITHVVLGPKHFTPENVVKDFLALSELPHAQVSRSISSYR